MNAEISIEHEMLRPMKTALNNALVSAMMAAGEGNVSTVTLKVDIEQLDKDQDVKTLMPISFNIKVSTKSDIVNEKSSIPSLRVVKGIFGNLLGESIDGQISVNDFMGDIEIKKKKQEDDDAPYSEKDYAKAKEQGLNLDDWDDYQKFYGLGAQEDYE